MKKVIIVHQWMAGADGDWYPWLKKELEAKEIEVLLPQFPNQDEPVIAERVSYLQNVVGIPNENTFFVGHSIGAQTIMRYFETLPEGTKVGGAVFVAGWFNLGGVIEGEDETTKMIAKPWVETPIDFEKVKSVCPDITVLLSSNEPYGFVEENKKIFEEKLNAKVIVLENKGHFSAAEGITELPEVLEEILKIA